MKNLKYIVFGIGVAVGMIIYRSIENSALAAIALIGVIILTAVLTTVVENKTEKK